MVMTPLRLHLYTYQGTVFFISVCLAFSLLGMFMLFHAPQIIQEATDDGIWDGLFGITLYAIFSLGFTFGGLFGAYDWFVEKPLWIEIGPRFTYCTLTGVHAHEWSDIDSIQLKHKVCEAGDEDDTSYSLSTSLVVTLVNEKQIDLGAESYDKRDKIFRTLVEGLSDGESGTRRFSAEALGRFRADALPDLQVEMKRMCETQREDFKEEAAAAECRAEAFEVLLSGIVPHLTEAMQNTDGDVRRAAGATLHRWGSQPLSPLPTAIATNARRKR
jgi:hypothetical protein